VKYFIPYPPWIVEFSYSGPQVQYRTSPYKITAVNLSRIASPRASCAEVPYDTLGWAHLTPAETMHSLYVTP